VLSRERLDFFKTFLPRFQAHRPEFRLEKMNHARTESSSEDVVSDTVRPILATHAPALRGTDNTYEAEAFLHVCTTDVNHCMSAPCDVDSLTDLYLSHVQAGRVSDYRMYGSRSHSRKVDVILPSPPQYDRLPCCVSFSHMTSLLNALSIPEDNLSPLARIGRSIVLTTFNSLTVGDEPGLLVIDKISVLLASTLIRTPDFERGLDVFFGSLSLLNSDNLRDAFYSMLGHPENGRRDGVIEQDEDNPLICGPAVCLAANLPVGYLAALSAKGSGRAQIPLSIFFHRVRNCDTALTRPALALYFSRVLEVFDEQSSLPNPRATETVSRSRTNQATLGDPDDSINAVESTAAARGGHSLSRRSRGRYRGYRGTRSLSRMVSDAGVQVATLVHPNAVPSTNREDARRDEVEHGASAGRRGRKKRSRRGNVRTVESLQIGSITLDS
jgi:hypothetical protein